MTLCPIAIVTGCRKCLVFKICPLKGIIGDYSRIEEPRKKKGQKVQDRVKRKG